MIIQHKGIERHFKRIQKVREFCFFGKKIQVNKIQECVYIPIFRASVNRKTRYTLKIGGVK